MHAGGGGSGQALREEVRRLQAERSSLLENGKMLKAALRKVSVSTLCLHLEVVVCTQFLKTASHSGPSVLCGAG